MGGGVGSPHPPLSAGVSVGGVGQGRTAARAVVGQGANGTVGQGRYLYRDPILGCCGPYLSPVDSMLS